MITAWILFLDLREGVYFFEEREGTDFTSTDPVAWGLDPHRHSIVLVLQRASFLSAWVEGRQLKGR